MMMCRFSPRVQVVLVLLVAAGLGGCPDRAPESAPDTAAVRAAEGAQAHLDAAIGDDQLSREVQNYRLSMQRIEQFAQAVRNVRELTRTDADLRQRMEELGGQEDRSPMEVASAMQQEPRLRSAIESAGLSVREYILVTLAFSQAAMAHEFQRQGFMQELPPGIPPENVAFIREHEEQLRPLIEGLEAEGEP